MKKNTFKDIKALIGSNILYNDELHINILTHKIVDYFKYGDPEWGYRTFEKKRRAKAKVLE